jgi:hypothetical protein
MIASFLLVLPSAKTQAAFTSALDAENQLKQVENVERLLSFRESTNDILIDDVQLEIAKFFISEIIFQKTTTGKLFTLVPRFSERDKHPVPGWRDLDGTSWYILCGDEISWDLVPRGYDDGKRRCENYDLTMPTQAQYEGLRKKLGWPNHYQVPPFLSWLNYCNSWSLDTLHGKPIGFDGKSGKFGVLPTDTNQNLICVSKPDMPRITENSETTKRGRTEMESEAGTGIFKKFRYSESDPNH